MRPRDTVPAARRVIRHNPSGQGKLAADVFAEPGSVVLAPLPGRVVRAGCPDTQKLPGCQILGFLTLPDGREMGFAAAHFQRGTHPEAGDTFEKGDVLGVIARWEQRPRSSHVHWSFRRPGEGRMPPPADINILEAFELCGDPPQETAGLADVPAEEMDEVDHEGPLPLEEVEQT